MITIFVILNKFTKGKLIEESQSIIGLRFFLLTAFGVRMTKKENYAL